MRDLPSVPLIQTLHPRVRAVFQGFIEAAEAGLNRTIRIVSAYRTIAAQQALWNQGRTTPGDIVTWAPPGSSYHNYGLAIDVCPLVTGTGHLDEEFDFHALLPDAAAAGLTAGLNFPAGMTDPDHFEDKLGYNWRTLLHLYTTGDFIPGTTFVNI